MAVLTYNRAPELMRTLSKLSALPERPELVVVDNGSSDDTRALVAQRFPAVSLLALARNMGAAARNAAVACLRTPYIAFCDDDTWWAAGALSTAAAILDAHPGIAVLSARILVGRDHRLDPACADMARSPLSSDGLPGPRILGFMAGACVFRRDAFIQAGGYEPRLFIGGEEALLALDLAAAGWDLVYCPDIVAHHHPSAQRNSRQRVRLLARNAVWVAWLRRPLRGAIRETLRALRTPGIRWPLLLLGAARGLPWLARHRRVIPAGVESMRSTLDSEGLRALGEWSAREGGRDECKAQGRMTSDA